MLTIAHIPMVALCDNREEISLQHENRFDACVERFDRSGLLESLAQLTTALGAHDAQEAQTPELVGGRR